MLSNLIECEANKNEKYYRVIQTKKEYSDGRKNDENFIDNDVARNSIELLYDELIKIKNVN